MAYQPQPILPPWKGVVDDVPSILALSSSFQSCVGFFVDKQRLRSVPKRTATTVPGPGTNQGPWDAEVSYSAGDIVTHSFASWYAIVGSLGIIPGTDATHWVSPLPVATPFIGWKSFVDANGNTHTVAITAGDSYYYVNGVYTLVAVNGLASLVPARTEVYQNKLIYTNGSNSPAIIDGSAFFGAVTLPNNGTCYFLGKLASRMLYLNLVEPAPGQIGSANLPRRFRWSKINDPNDFTDFTSGVADIPEVEDNITGFATQGALGYIYRTSGISAITPTGGISPTFFIENYSASGGVGNFFPYSLAQWGNLTCFASAEDIQAFNPLLGPPQPIGGPAARSIYTDLSNASGYVTGALLPGLGFERQNLQYWLAIPFADNTTAIWMYQFDSQSWTKQTVPFSVTSVAMVAVG